MAEMKEELFQHENESKLKQNKTTSLNTRNDESICMNNQPVTEFVYLDKAATADRDVEEKIRKTRKSFGILKNMQKSRLYFGETKIRIFDFNVTSVIYIWL